MIDGDKAIEFLKNKLINLIDQGIIKATYGESENTISFYITDITTFLFAICIYIILTINSIKILFIRFLCVYLQHGLIFTVELVSLYEYE